MGYMDMDIWIYGYMKIWGIWEYVYVDLWIYGDVRPFFVENMVSPGDCLPKVSVFIHPPNDPTDDPDFF